MLLSGQPQIDVTTPPDELHGKVNTDDSGVAADEARGTVASGTVVRKLLGTAYSAVAEVNEALGEAVVVVLGKVDSAAADEVPGCCWHNRVRQCGGSGEPHSATGLTVDRTHNITVSKEDICVVLYI